MYPHAGLGAAVGTQDVDVLPAGTGGEHRPFTDAEPHFPRSQVRAADQQLTQQVFRFVDVLTYYKYPMTTGRLAGTHNKTKRWSSRPMASETGNSSNSKSSPSMKLSTHQSDEP